MLNRTGAVPRSTLYLAAVLVLAAGALFLARRGQTGPDHTLGGPLFAADPAQVQSLLLTKGQAQHRLERTPSGTWTLTGAYTDFLNQDAVESLLADLATATGGRLLPGTEPEDRRYGFNGPGAMRLTLMDKDRTTETLVLGTLNPVTNTYYASGAGREACFPVAVGLQQRLQTIPLALLQQSLLPPFAAESMDSVAVWSGDVEARYLRRDGRWWLALNPGDETRLGPIFRDLLRLYPDRVVAADGRRLALANDAEVYQLIHDVSRVVADEVLTGAYGAEARERFGFDAPWRRIVLHGAAINPDPGLGSADRLEIAFGQRTEADVIPVARRGVVLLTSVESVITLEKPLADLLDLGAMPLLLARGDSLTVEQDGAVILAGHRDATIGARTESMRVRSSDQWFTHYPSHKTEVYDAGQWHRMCRSLLVNLDRTPILAVLPPTRDPSVLQARERLRIRVRFNSDDGPDRAPGTVDLEMGYLELSKLPAGSPPLVDDNDNLPPVGLWDPVSGRLFQVSGHTLVSARSWRL